MVKDYKDYLVRLKRMYPDLTEEMLEQVVRKGLSTFQDLIKRDHDIRLTNTNGQFDKYRLILYRSQKDEQAKKARYFRNLIRIDKYRADKKKQYEARLQSK